MSFSLEPPPLASIEVSTEDIKTNIFLRFCCIFDFISAIVGLSSGILHAYAVIYPCHELLNDRWEWIPLLVTRIFGIIFGVVIAFQDSKFKYIFVYLLKAISCEINLFQDSWIGRGLLMLLSGCVLQLCAMATSPASKPLSQCGVPPSTRYVAGALALVGVLHFCFGCLCIDYLRDWGLNAIRKRKLVVWQARQLSKHKDEVEELLRQSGEEGI